MKPAALHARARRVLPGGVTASARLIPFLNRPIYLARGEGAYVFDLQGRRYLDCWNSHGASLLGHGHPAIVRAVQRALDMGILCAAESELSVQLAERLSKLIPCAEQVRFTCSGTETTWHAVRLARAFTGRTHVLKFEGHFHGYNDTLGFSMTPPLDARPPYVESAGTPPDARKYITVVPFNDLPAVKRAIKTRASDLAAVILEPIHYDCFGIRPQPGFLQAVQEVTRRAGAVLIFDEILSGFRTGPGGAQEFFGVRPDLCTLGKALGGGMPISAFAGRRDIMRCVSPTGRAVHSGTYNAHLTAVAAALAFLDVIAKPRFYPRLLKTGEKLYAGLREAFARAKLPVCVMGTGARFGLAFGTQTEPRDYREAVSKHNAALAARFYAACLKRGVYFHHVSPHHGYSSAHTDADVSETLNVVEDAAKAVAGGRG